MPVAMHCNSFRQTPEAGLRLILACISTSEFSVKIPNHHYRSSLLHITDALTAGTEYPTKEEIHEAYLPSLPSTVFYTSGAPREAATRFARASGGGTYRDCWPHGFLSSRSGN